MNHDRRLSGPFQQARSTGNGEACDEPSCHVRRDQERKRRGNPHAQAIKAVEQLTHPAVARFSAQTNQEVCRAVLADEQVSDPPRREDGKYQSKPHARIEEHRQPILAWLQMHTGNVW